MTDHCKESQELIDRCHKKLEALRNKLEVQKGTLRNLRRMAEELAPLMEGVDSPEKMPEKYQQEFNHTMQEINSITESMRPKKSHKPARRHNLV